ncbi:uncharacterized protein LOC132195002 [Neocloeon triangulifer]|uniref:uncharacterized protein LOC132195002 n=1 Tax=Neocloeon triangulifer TaxID=2078957 RepID=UPI00286F5E0D|nr:uncharacterized protein LOC132195002 [Neocloeon triangulifer]
MSDQSDGCPDGPRRSATYPRILAANATSSFLPATLRPPAQAAQSTQSTRTRSSMATLFGGTAAGNSPAGLVRSTPSARQTLPAPRTNSTGSSMGLLMQAPLSSHMVRPPSTAPLATAPRHQVQASPTINVYRAQSDRYPQNSQSATLRSSSLPAPFHMSRPQDRNIPATSCLPLTSERRDGSKAATDYCPPLADVPPLSERLDTDYSQCQTEHTSSEPLGHQPDGSAHCQLEPVHSARVRSWTLSPSQSMPRAAPPANLTVTVTRHAPTRLSSRSTWAVPSSVSQSSQGSSQASLTLSQRPIQRSPPPSTRPVMPMRQEKGRRRRSSSGSTTSDGASPSKRAIAVTNDEAIIESEHGSPASSCKVICQLQHSPPAVSARLSGSSYDFGSLYGSYSSSEGRQPAAPQKPWSIPDFEDLVAANPSMTPAPTTNARPPAIKSPVDNEATRPPSRASSLDAMTSEIRVNSTPPLTLEGYSPVNGSPIVRPRRTKAVLSRLILPAQKSPTETHHGLHERANELPQPISQSLDGLNKDFGNGDSPNEELNDQRDESENNAENEQNGDVVSQPPHQRRSTRVSNAPLKFSDSALIGHLNKLSRHLSSRQVLHRIEPQVNQAKTSGTAQIVQEARPDWIRKCFIPGCDINSRKDPTKKLFSLTKSVPLRHVIFRMIRERIDPNYQSKSIQSGLYCCELHYKIPGDVRPETINGFDKTQWRLNPMTVPSKLKKINGAGGTILWVEWLQVSKPDEQVHKSQNSTAQPESQVSGGMSNADSPRLRFTEREKQKDPDFIFPGSLDTESSSQHHVEKAIRAEKASLRHSVALDMMLERPDLFLGISKENIHLIDALAKKVGPTPEKGRDKVLLTIRKVKLNESFEILGLHFGISKSKANEIFKATLPTIADCLRETIGILKPQLLVRNLPIPFRYEYSKVTHIIDCFEIQTQIPSDACDRAITFSSYKACNTIKYLISCTPDGYCNFVSAGYGGRRHDMAFIQQSGILDHVIPGRTVLVDRGFKNVDTVFESKGVRMEKPPSVRKGIPMDEDQGPGCKKIAALRIHIERLIGRVRNFKMVSPHACIPSSMIQYLDDAVAVAVGLANFSPPLIRR